MRLAVKQNDHTISEFRFAQGPIYIGRRTDSQVFLADRTVSRHHAVIFNTAQGKWVIEDLDSANKTYLNDEPIHKAQINTGDFIRIGDFTIEIDLRADNGDKKKIHLDDTLTTPYTAEDTRTPTALKPQVIVRRIDTDHAPDIRLPGKRAREFMQATEAICKTNNLEDMLKVLLYIASKQFTAFHTWCALRNSPAGQMACQAGKQRSGARVNIKDIKLSEKIDLAVEKKQFLLFPRIPPQRQKERIHSAMIAPIVGIGGCFGVVYIDNAMDHEHYSLSDLDYLMLIAIHTAVILENF